MVILEFLVNNPNFYSVQEIRCCGFQSESSSEIFRGLVDEGLMESSPEFGV